MGELRFLATDAARAAFGELRAAHPTETFYGFAFIVGTGPLHVSAAANTEEGLTRTAERFAQDGYGTAERFAQDGYGTVEALSADAPGSLRWRTVDWEHHDVGVPHFGDVAAFVADTYGDADPDAIVDELSRELVGAVRDLNREDFFGWGPERDAVVVLIDTGDPADLLEHARDINPATPFARLQAALG